MMKFCRQECQWTLPLIKKTHLTNKLNEACVDLLKIFLLPATPFGKLRKLVKLIIHTYLFSFIVPFFQQTFGLIVTFVKLTKSAELTT